MHLALVWIIAAATAVADSASHALSPDFIHALADSTKIAGWVAPILSVIPAQFQFAALSLVVPFVVDLIEHGLENLRGDSPFGLILASIDDYWKSHKTLRIGVPLIAAWGLSGTWLTGAVGVALRSWLTGGSLLKANPDAMKKLGPAVAAALVACLVLAPASPVRAAGRPDVVTPAPIIPAPVTAVLTPLKVSLLDPSRRHYVVALTERWTADQTLSFRGQAPHVGAKLGFTWAYSDHLVIPASVWRQLADKSNAWQAEAGIGLAW